MSEEYRGTGDVHQQASSAPWSHESDSQTLSTHITTFQLSLRISYKFHGSSYLAASSSTRPTRATSPRGCYEDVARVGRLPRSACNARSAAVRSAARLSVCYVVLHISRARHARLIEDKSLNIIVAFSSDTPDFLVTC